MRDNENSDRTWYLFADLENALGKLDDPEFVERAERILTALAATAGEVVRSSRHSVANTGAVEAKRLLDDIRTSHEVGHKASILAGRLAMLTDLLGLAVTRRAPDNLERTARELLPTLRALHGRPLSNKDLAAALGVQEETAWRYLRNGRKAHLIEVEREGRLAVNRLSDLALALDEAGVIALADGGWSMQTYLTATTPDKSPPKAGRALPMLQVAVE